MDTIIGLLIVLIPVIFKLIGNRMEKAAKEQQAQQPSLSDWTETLRRQIEQLQQEARQEQEQQLQPMQETPTFVSTATAEPAIAPQQAPARKQKQTRAKASVQKPKRPAVEPAAAAQSQKKEKIDPKKLIVYSEIMKPKYTERS